MSEPPLWPDGTPIPGTPAETGEDAEQRYRRTLDHDPFPDIPEALLNAADVYDYVCATGMVCPFDAACMKGASYEVSIGDRCIYWGDDRTPYDLPLADGQTFVLRKNSIVFVTTKEEFRLPHYIALRFNLRITNVHRGILLGTGPLVDPGFAGRLLIPLHNLTTNDYVFKKGEHFAWFEFTKISPHDLWRADYREKRRKMGLRGEYKKFPESKKGLQPKNYFDKALLNVSPRAIASSIPQSVLEAEKIAKEAKQDANSIKNWVASLGVAGFVAILLAITAILQGSWQLVSEIQQSVSGTRASLAELTTRLNEALPQVDRTVETLSARTSRISDAADDLRRIVESNAASTIALQRQIEEIQTNMEVLRDAVDDIRGRYEEQ